MQVVYFNDHRVRKAMKLEKLAPGEALIGNELKLLRQEHNVRRRQLAVSLEVSVGTIERWEGLETFVPISRTALSNAITLICARDPSFESGRNLCFGRFSMRTAREIFGLSIEEMAKKYDYSVSQWKKIEGHERTLKPKIIREIELEIQELLKAQCP
jgi:DNA-binding XRE family transcriptional regulator